MSYLNKTQGKLTLFGITKLKRAQMTLNFHTLKAKRAIINKQLLKLL